MSSTDVITSRNQCARCTFWHPEGKIKGVFRQWGTCNLNGQETRLDETCWAYKEVSLNQLNRRKQNGLIEEV